MALRHANGLGGFQNGRVDSGKTHIGVAENRKQRIQDQRNNGGACSNAAQEGNRNQKTEQSKAGNGLENIGQAKRESAQSRMSDDENPQRNGDGNGDGHGKADEYEMLANRRQDFSMMIGEECPQVHTGCPGRNSEADTNSRTVG